MGLESLLTGRLLADRYRIEEVIGRGGMGAVYRATDERLGRRVAVKVITLAGADDPEARERLRQRFLREARAAAALPHHANVVPVYDFGTDESLGLDFLVMELLSGEDLASLLARSGPPPLSTGLRILLGAARGIAVGHRSGLVHRDVKPGNIFLVADEHGDTQVRVLDFGIAKLVDDDTLSQLTQDGRVPLSPAFASPEQLRGLSKISPASDVFSLGAVGFLLLTGQRPFTEEDRNRISLGMPVEVPSLRRLNPAIPPTVEEVIRRALSFDATDRHPDAIAFAGQLDEARNRAADAPLPPYSTDAEQSPVQPRRPAPDEDRTEFLDDRTLLDPAAAGTGSAPEMTAALGAPEPKKTVPLPPRRRPRERGARRGWLVTTLVVLLLAGAGGVFAFYTLGGEWPTVQEPVVQAPPEVPDIDVPAVEPPDPAPTELDAFMYNAEGDRHFQAGRYEQALERFRLAVDASPGDAGYRHNYALTLLRLDRVGEAVQEFQRVIRQDPNLAPAHFNLAEARLVQGDTTAAIVSLEEAVRVSRTASERATAERRLRDVRAAVLAPPPTPEPVPAPAPAPIQPQVDPQQQPSSPTGEAGSPDPSAADGANGLPAMSPG